MQPEKHICIWIWSELKANIHLWNMVQLIKQNSKYHAPSRVLIMTVIQTHFGSICIYGASNSDSDQVILKFHNLPLQDIFPLISKQSKNTKFRNCVPPSLPLLWPTGKKTIASIWKYKAPQLNIKILEEWSSLTDIC